MSERPILSKELDSQSFLNFYYLKEELIDFCRENGLPVYGGKFELTERIAHFLDTGCNIILLHHIFLHFLKEQL